MQVAESLGRLVGLHGRDVLWRNSGGQAGVKHGLCLPCIMGKGECCFLSKFMIRTLALY